MTGRRFGREAATLTLALAIGVTGAVAAVDPAMGSAAGGDDDPPPYAIGVDFENDVMPVLTRAGCNTGECHGAALGQADFRLSLLGYDPDFDWRAITRELRGRRVDLVDPASSLILRKASRRIYHGGGRKLAADSEGYSIVAEWIAAGAPRRADERSLAAIDVEVVDGAQIEVTARYDDGSWRDVTRFSLFSSNDDSMVEVEDTGELFRYRPGATSLVARYGGLIEAREELQPFGRSTVRLPEFEPLDARVSARLAELGLDPPAAADDTLFLRRATLDLAGRLPRLDEVAAFERAPDREALVERLIGSEDFQRHWAFRLSELFPERDGVANWLARALRAERGWDDVVAEALTVDGDHPAGALFQSNDPKKMAESVAQGFLGQSIQCAQCHNHPFSTFTRSDYFGVASFFARVRFDEGRLELAERGELRIPGEDDAVVPAFPGGDRALLREGQDRREALAGWIVEQPDFARSLVNRVWDALMGEGLVEPLDDLRPSNPGRNPALLDELAERFVENGHDLRALVREIVGSAAYASLKRPRLLPGAVLHDALADATGVPDAVQAVHVPTLESELLACSGDSTRFEGSLAQSLHLIAAPDLELKLSTMPRYELDELFLRTLSRRPTAAERELEPRTREEYEDLVWALLNSTEFLYVR